MLKKILHVTKLNDNSMLNGNNNSTSAILPGDRAYSIINGLGKQYMTLTCGFILSYNNTIRQFVGCPRTGGAIQDVHITPGFGPSKQTFVR